jgi:hypothetical protein
MAKVIRVYQGGCQVSGYRALSAALRELGYDDRDKIVRLSSAVKTLLDQAADKTYNEHIEQAIPQFDELLTVITQAFEELATNPDMVINHAYKKLTEAGFDITEPSSAGINPVPGLEMGEPDFTVLGGK